MKWNGDNFARAGIEILSHGIVRMLSFSRQMEMGLWLQVRAMYFLT